MYTDIKEVMGSTVTKELLEVAYHEHEVTCIAEMQGTENGS